jgi:arylsulfatase
MSSPEWANKYAGRRHGIRAVPRDRAGESKKLGIVPPDTELSPVNPYAGVTGPDGQPWPLLDTVRPWESLSDSEKRLFARMAEVFAGFLSYTDDQLGRVLDYLEESGQLDNTIIVVISETRWARGGPTVRSTRSSSSTATSTRWRRLRFYDQLGGPQTYNHYPIGWAICSAAIPSTSGTPHWWHADSAIISWPNGIARTARFGTPTSMSATSPPVYELWADRSAGRRRFPSAP